MCSPYCVWFCCCFDFCYCCSRCRCCCCFWCKPIQKKYTHTHIVKSSNSEYLMLKSAKNQQQNDYAVAQIVAWWRWFYLVFFYFFNHIFGLCFHLNIGWNILFNSSEVASVVCLSFSLALSVCVRCSLCVRVHAECSAAQQRSVVCRLFVVWYNCVWACSCVRACWLVGWFIYCISLLMVLLYDYDYTGNDGRHIFRLTFASPCTNQHTRCNWKLHKMNK